MSSDDEDMRGVDALGLNKILADTGVDPSAFNNLYAKTGGQSSGAYAGLDSDDENAKYMDEDVDENLPEDDDAARVRQQREAEEERWYKRALEMQRKAEGKDAVADRKRKAAKREETAVEVVKRIWPEWEKGKRLRMSEIFYETPAQLKVVHAQLKRAKREDKERVEHKFKVGALPETTSLAAFLQQSLPQLPESTYGLPLYDTPLGAKFDPEWIKAAKALRRDEMRKPPPDIKLEEEADQVQVERTLDLADWENEIVYTSFRPDGTPNVPTTQESTALAPRNNHLEAGDWIKDVIWDATRVSSELLDSDDEVQEADSKKQLAIVGKGQDNKLDMFNLSNDHLYEQAREAKFRIRQTFGSIEVFHAGPAKCLQLPFYKTTLTKTEARAWHRPGIQFPVGVSLNFSKLKSNMSGSANTKKRAVVADPSERFKTTRDLTMSEKGTFVLLEFSEEYPPIMSGYGMGTTIVNYYRKKDDKDEHVPKLDFGQPSILNVGDAEPFLLGYVDRGKVTQVIHNNLIRAPIFRHQPETSDFLVVRQTINGVANYYIRAINNLYTVGQTMPNQSEVPGPHARKSTHTAKQRLQIVAWLLIEKSKTKRIKLSRLMKYFPDQTELQMRQRLKIKGSEFLLFERQPGPNQGHWVLNPAYPWPKERKEVLEQCTPEMAVLYEATQVGARHLHDAGYSKTAEGKEEEEVADESGLDIEQQLAVWSTTLNYKKAEGQKAWLVVHGDGEPTGRGEGFSFLRTNMKSYFLRKGETEAGRRLEAEAKANGEPVKISNAQQQQIYEEEKRKVWDLQWKALSNPSPPDLMPEDELHQPTAANFAGFSSRIGGRGDSRARSRGRSMAATPAYDSPRDRSPSAFSGDGESTYTGAQNQNKVLRIRRVKNGRESVEVVRDQAVVKQYLRRKEEQKLAHYMNNPDLLERSGDAEENEIIKAAMRMKIEQMKKNQARRIARKKSMRGELEVYEGDETGKRKCGACGQIGHTRANRMCPKFSAQSVGPSPAAGTTPTAQTPGGYGMPFNPTDGAMLPPPETNTSFKIRLGTGKPQ